MSIQHHDNPNEQAAMQRFIDEVRRDSERKWPHGRVSGDDDGESAFAIAADPLYRIVRIQFTKPMNWIGLDVQSARHMAKLLTEKADEVEKTPITTKLTKLPGAP